MGNNVIEHSFQIRKIFSYLYANQPMHIFFRQLIYPRDMIKFDIDTSYGRQTTVYLFEAHECCHSSNYHASVRVWAVTQNQVLPLT